MKIAVFRQQWAECNSVKHMPQSDAARCERASTAHLLCGYIVRISRRWSGIWVSRPVPFQRCLRAVPRVYFNYIKGWGMF